jgi:hypothetical protein
MSARITARHTQEELDAFDRLPLLERDEIAQNVGSEKFKLLYGYERWSIFFPEEARIEPLLTMKYPDGNPKTQFGVVKPRDTYTPPIPYLEYSLAHLQGALKYGPFNWRDDPVTMSTYLDAAISHINKFRAGQDRATDTDIHELGHAMTCLSIVIDAQAYGTITDDRWRPRDPEAHPWGNNPAKVLDDYIEQNQSRVKAIKEKWTGFQERFKRGEINSNGDPIK